MLPDYHRPDLVGCQTDSRVLLSETQRVLPELFSHLESLFTVAEVAFLPWFLQLYVNVLPPVVALRVWDLLLSGNSLILLSVGLAILDLSSVQLMAAASPPDLQTALKSAPLLLVDGEALVPPPHASIT